MPKLQTQITEALDQRLRTALATVRAEVEGEYTKLISMSSSELSSIASNRDALDAHNLRIRNLYDLKKRLTISALIIGLLSQIDRYSMEELSDMMRNAGIILGRPVDGSSTQKSSAEQCAAALGSMLSAPKK